LKEQRLGGARRLPRRLPARNAFARRVTAKAVADDGPSFYRSAF